jgi:hypothetical protein
MGYLQKFYDEISEKAKRSDTLICALRAMERKELSAPTLLIPPPFAPLCFS